MAKQRERNDAEGEAERLRFELVKIEALARAAGDALAGLPFVRDWRRRARVQRLVALVEATASAASSALGTNDDPS